MGNHRTVSLPAPALPISAAQLTAIVADASLLWERFDPARFAVEPVQSDEIIQLRLERWCEVVAQGNWEVFRKRLQWDGLDLEAVRPRLGSVRAALGGRLPDWADTLHRIVASAMTFRPQKHASLPTDAQDPIPFEDLLLPALRVAREKLLSRLGGLRLAEDCLPLSVLTPPAYRSLERSLLKRLARLCGKTLDLEFSSTRRYGKNVLYLLGVEADDSAGTGGYTTFVQQLLRDGMLGFLGKYPVLARLMALAVDFWAESTAEFVQRLEQDRVEILRAFPSAADDAPDRVSEIQSSLSDSHARGRSVLLLGFESGLKVIYKPKDLGLEVAFNAFIDWCNRTSRLLDLKVIKVLARDGYGWVEYIDHRPCADVAAAQRFYERAGMLLCVLYVLRGTDCHHENLIAHGEHLVLIDMETLLYPEANPIENSSDAPEFETAAVRQFWDSVLRTGLLPRWNVSGDGSVTYDISGLGSTQALTTRWKIPRWRQINTDGMHVRQEFMKANGQKNLPRIGDAALSPDDYHREMLAGFEKMYRVFCANKVLLAAGSPLPTLQDQ
jgi:type 2 lantibiotic biosynthesis protein LanM